MLVRCLGRHANYLRAHLLPGIPCEFVARDQLRCRSEQPVPCRDEAPRRRPWTARAGRGARAPARQATSRHAPPDACRHPILASKPFLPTAYRYLVEVQAVFGINFLRFDARSRLCAPRLGTGFAATVSRTPSPRMVEGPINSFHRQVARRPRNAETTESTADEP